MAHEVEALLFAHETPWHRVGERINDDQSRDVDYIKAHPAVAWTCEKRSLYLADGREADTRAVVRSTDGHVLGEVGRDFTIVQNHEAIEWFRPFVESGAATIECVGALRGGSRVFALAKLNRDPMSVVPGDDILPYLLLANAHDGSLRLHVGFTPIRVVCANTLQMARTDRRSNLLQLRHTPGIKLALETVQETIDVAQREFSATVEQFRRLALTGCNEETLRRFVSVVFSARPTDVSAPDEAREAGNETRSRVFPVIRRLFEAGRGAEIAGVRGTLWGAVNAVSEFAQYERGTDEVRRLNETWFGSGSALNRRALDAALAIAA
jgi:phage/plasmid-like protein (TIGR03299 family)